MLCYTEAEECGGRYTQESGTIEYPPGDSNYGYNEYCVWHVELTDSSSRIAVNVTEFQLGSDCSYDYLAASIYTYIPGILIRTNVRKQFLVKKVLELLECVSSVHL